MRKYKSEEILYIDDYDHHCIKKFVRLFNKNITVHFYIDNTFILDFTHADIKNPIYCPFYINDKKLIIRSLINISWENEPLEGFLIDG